MIFFKNADDVTTVPPSLKHFHILADTIWQKKKSFPDAQYTMTKTEDKTHRIQCKISSSRSDLERDFATAVYLSEAPILS